MATYSHTKLMQAAFARALQSHYSSHPNKSHRLVFSWEPGLVKSNILSQISSSPYDRILWLLSKLQPLVGLDIRQGSATGVHLATSCEEEVLEGRGRYFDRMWPRVHPVDGYGREKLERLCTRWAADAEIEWPW
jgi:hypothetical protein